MYIVGGGRDSISMLNPPFRNRELGWFDKVFNDFYVMMYNMFEKYDLCSKDIKIEIVSGVCSGFFYKL